MTITIVGDDNSITAGTGIRVSNIEAEGTTTINGTGTLTISATDNNGIYCSPTDLEISGDVTLDIEAEYNAICGGNIVTIGGNADVTAISVGDNGNAYGIQGPYGIEIKDGTTVVAKALHGGLVSLKGNIVIDGNVTATATSTTNAAISAGLNKTADYSVSVGGNLTIGSGSYVGIGITGTGSLTIDGAIVNIPQATYALFTGMNAASGGDILIKDSTITMANVTMGTYPACSTSTLTNRFAAQAPSNLRIRW